MNKMDSDKKRTEDQRLRLKRMEKHLARLAASNLKLGAYKEAAECALKAEGIRFALSQWPKTL